MCTRKTGLCFRNAYRRLGGGLMRKHGRRGFGRRRTKLGNRIERVMAAHSTYEIDGTRVLRLQRADAAVSGSEAALTSVVRRRARMSTTLKESEIQILALAITEQTEISTTPSNPPKRQKTQHLMEVKRDCVFSPEREDISRLTLHQPGS